MSSRPDESDASTATEDSDSEESTKPILPAPRIQGGVVDFAVGNITPHLTCSLCNGYFRNPTKIVECLHTFCGSCLNYTFLAGFTRCPACSVDLGPDPYAKTKLDRPLETLVDRVLFPEMKTDDDDRERAFYQDHGIRMKAQYLYEDKRDRSGRRDAKQDPFQNEIEFTLTPHYLVPPNARMKPLERELVRTSGKAKIITIKRYIISQIPGLGGVDPSAVEVYCGGRDLLGNEQNLTFVHRTIWLPEHETRMDLNYCLARDSSSNGGSPR